MKSTKKSRESFKIAFIKEITRSLERQDDGFYKALNSKDINLIIVLVMQIILPAISYAYIKGKYNDTGSEDWKSSGSKDTKFKTLSGEMQYKLPIIGGKIFKPRCTMKSRNACPRIKAIAIILYSLGLSVRDIATFISAVTTSNISKDIVSNIIKSPLDKVVKHFTQRKINCSDDPIVLLAVDCIHFSIKMPCGKIDKYFSMAFYVVNSRRLSGRKEILGVSLSKDECSETWEKLFKDLLSRGMNIPQIVTRDGSTASLKAIKEIFPSADIQTCHFHFLANLKRLCEIKKLSKEIYNEFEEVFSNSCPELIEDGLDKLLVGKWNNYADDIKLMLEDEYLFTYLKYDTSMYSFIRTNNLVENINQNLRIVSSHHKQFQSPESLFRALIPCLVKINRGYKVEHMNNCKNGTLNPFNTSINDYDELSICESIFSNLNNVSSDKFRVSYKVGGRKEVTFWTSTNNLSQVKELK